MFQKYIIDGKELTIIDSEFIDEIDISKEYTDYIFNNIVRSYEKRNLNVASNIIRYFYYAATQGYDFERMAYLSYGTNKYYEKYKSEIEKYLTLI
jgi:hypothetical protein